MDGRMNLVWFKHIQGEPQRDGYEYSVHLQVLIPLRVPVMDLYCTSTATSSVQQTRILPRNAMAPVSCVVSAAPLVYDPYKSSMYYRHRPSTDSDARKIKKNMGEKKGPPSPPNGSKTGLFSPSVTLPAMYCAPFS